MTSSRPLGGSGGWRRVLRWVLVLLVLELVVIWLVSRAIGPWPTFAVLVAESMLGGWLVRREGARELRALSAALSQGQLPPGGGSDAVLVLVGGLLLLVPGFLTDLVGFACVLPVTRPGVRTLLARLARRVRRRYGSEPSGLPRVVTTDVRMDVETGTRTGTEGDRAATGRPFAGPPGPVLRGEVVDLRDARSGPQDDPPPHSDGAGPTS